MRIAAILFTLTLLILISMMQFDSSNTGGEIDPAAFKEKLEKSRGIVIDVRTQREYDEGHLTDTDLLIDYLSDEFEEKLNELDREETYYLYCRTGNRSGKAMRKMRRAGFREVYNIGGFEDLVSAGFRSER